jgi:hypothetical protein
VTAFGRLLPITTGSDRPILLKKSIMVSAAEKYASEIEIFTFGRGFQTQKKSGSDHHYFKCGLSPIFIR